jgi:glycolate oxidase iron-sulfur subunit
MALLEAYLHDHKELTPNLIRALSLCLLCGTCSATCPNGAEAHEAIRQARAIFARKRGLPLPKRMVSKWAAADRPRRDRVLRGAAALEEILTTELAEDRGLRFRLPVRGFHDAWVPRLARPFFLERVPGEVCAPNPKAKVGVFVGCAIHYMAPHVGDATLGLINGLGFTVIIPEDQACCGLMAYGMGDQRAAQQLASKTIQTFQEQELEAIVAPCASCASHLKLGYPRLFQHSPSKRRAAEAFSNKVWELSAFLVQHRPLERQEKEETARPEKAITYHDPCHLVRHMGIREEPRRLLRSLHSMVYREMAGADQCCGMGGSFRLFHSGVSRGVLHKKVQSISQSEAKVVATGCMGCWIQLQEGVRAEGLDVEVKHLADCLWAEKSSAKALVREDQLC